MSQHRRASSDATLQNITKTAKRVGGATGVCCRGDGQKGWLVTLVCGRCGNLPKTCGWEHVCVYEVRSQVRVCKVCVCVCGSGRNQTEGRDHRVWTLLRYFLTLSIQVPLAFRDYENGLFLS